MHLNQLCFVLPVDSDEIDLADPPKPPRTRPNHRDNSHHHRRQHRNCLPAIGRCLRRVWHHACTDTPASRECPGSFHDMPGVELAENRSGNNPRIFGYTELYIGSNGFSESELLGSGGFGRVYRAVLPSDGTKVAVKCVAEKGESFEKTFVAELMAVASLRHRNLVRLRGWCVHEDQLMLVYDYMPNRSLDHILFRRPGGHGSAKVLDWDRRVRIVTGLAAALFYLHEQLETQIIHRDVKTSNVMLDSNFNARLGDFGLARWLEHELELSSPMVPVVWKNQRFRLEETTRVGGTIGYLPPESFQKRSGTTAKSDVFSFGVVVLEVVSGRRAVDLAYPDEQIILLDWVRCLSDNGKHIEAGDSRLSKGSYELSAMRRLIHLALLCSLNDPQLRPTMKWVVEALSGCIGELPALPSFNSHPYYITLSSTSASSATTKSTITSKITSTTTASYESSTYITAPTDTMYITADNANSHGTTTNHRNRAITFHSVNTPQEISYKDLAAATNDFSESRRIAELDFGTAYYGHLNHRHILVKRLGMKTCPALRGRFADELRNLKQLRHRNLVQLRGWCTEHGEMLVVFDYSASHMLSHLLFHHQYKRHPVLQWHQRYNIIKSLASAIIYLHEDWDDQVIHRNITSSAVFLDSDLNPRLGSFALAAFLTRNEHSEHVVVNPRTSVQGIFGYMAPEYMEFGEATPAADIYSFGVVLLEIVSGRMAVDFQCPEVLLVKKVREFETRERPFAELVDRRLDGEYNNKELERLVNLGVACTRSDPKLRPTMRQIVSTLDGNDKWLKAALHKEKMDEWHSRNGCSLSLIRRVQALGIQ